MQPELIDYSTGEIMSTDNWFDELINPNAERKANDIFKLFAVYKYVKVGKDKEKVKNDKRWDKLNLTPDIMKVSKKILEAFDMDLQKAAQCVLEIGEYYEKSYGGPWSLHAVYRRITDWEEGRLK